MRVKTYNWPMVYEYDEAMRDRNRTFSDPDIQRGSLLETSPGQPLRLNAGGSQYICVFRISDWVIRCFTSDQSAQVFPPTDILLRHQGITTYMKRPGNALPFLTSYDLVEPGVKIKGEYFPYLKMRYITNSRSLGDYLSDNYKNSRVVGEIAKLWIDLIQKMEAREIAHGDLDLSNVLVLGNYPRLSLRLIDFDGMYVPDFGRTSMSTADNGHADFQPPQPSIRNFDHTMDRFSALVIYLSLCALETNPDLWEKCDATDRNLLLREDDFQRLSQSQHFALLRNESKNTCLQRCLDEVQESIEQGRMPRSLKEILILGKKDYIVSSVSLFPPNAPPVSSSSLPRYEGRGREIPLDEPDATSGRQVVEASTSSLDTPGASSCSQNNTAPSSGRHVAPSPQSSSKARLIAFVIIILIVAVALIIWWVIQLHQPPQHPSAALFLLQSVTHCFRMRHL